MNMVHVQGFFVRLVIAAGTVLFILLQAANIHSQDDPDLMAMVEDFALKRYNGIPYQKAKQFNADALPILEELLNDPINEVFYSTIVQTIGIIGDEKGLGILIHFLEKRFEGEVNIAQHRGLYMVNIAIGHIAANGSKQAFDYLVDGTDEKTWEKKELKWRYEGRSIKWTYVEAVKTAIAGLGVTGSDKAEEVLLKLQAVPESEEMRKKKIDSIRGSLKIIRRIKKRGGYEDFFKDPWKDSDEMP